MYNDYLKKNTAYKRTGANLISINPDTELIGYDQNYKAIFDELERIAEKTDNIKIKNEKMKIDLNVDKAITDIREAYFSDPTIYKDQTKWEETCKAWDRKMKDLKAEVADSKWLNPEEKTLFNRQMDLRFAKEFVPIREKRNIETLKERSNECVMLYETALMNAKNNSSEIRTDAIDTFIQKATPILKNMGEINGMTEIEQERRLAEGLIEIEAHTYKKRMQQHILNNPNLSNDEKAEQLEKTKELMSNPERINSIVEGYGKYLGDDSSKAFLKACLNELYTEQTSELNYKIGMIKKHEKQVKLENAREIEEAKEKRNTSKYIAKIYEIPGVSTEQLVNEPDKLDLVTDKDITYFDGSNGKAFPLLTDGVNSAINKNIKINFNSQVLSYRECYEPLYKYARECSQWSGDISSRIEDIEGQAKYKALIIDYGLKNGINPDLLLKGEKDPEYFRISGVMADGFQAHHANKIDYDMKKLRKNKEFVALAKEFSPNTLVGEKLALTYLAGRSKGMGELDEYILEPSSFINAILTDKKSLNSALEEVKYAREIYLKRNPYEYENYNLKKDRGQQREYPKKEIKQKTEQEKEIQKKQEELFY